MKKLTLILFALLTSGGSLFATKMNTPTKSIAVNARSAPTRFLNMENNKIAYRTFGKGRAIIMYNRFRGTLDTWDPAFPMLILSGDHDPSYPVENWFPLVRKWKTAQLHVIPSSGHGVQHEFPEFSFKLITIS